MKNQFKNLRLNIKERRFILFFSILIKGTMGRLESCKTDITLILRQNYLDDAVWRF